MVQGISSTSNLVGMISSIYQTGQSASVSSESRGAQPPSPPPGTEDPLGVYDTVDADGDGSVSESEFELLTEGILEATGSTIAQSFAVYDTDSDGSLSGSELKSVLDEAGFEPPPPPPQQVAEAYEAQSGSSDDNSLMAHLLAYLENVAGGTGIIA